jgi:hypothetical protein
LDRAGLLGGENIVCIIVSNIDDDQSDAVRKLSRMNRMVPAGKPKLGTTLDAVNYSGVTIPVGSPVYALSQFANRDPEVF